MKNKSFTYNENFELINLISDKLIELKMQQWQENNEIHLIKFTGKSMNPFLKNGDILKVHFLQNAVFQIGDIVLFKQQNNLIAHRLIDKTIQNSTNVFLEIGDNGFNPTFLNPIFIVGKIIGVVKKNYEISINSEEISRFNLKIASLQRNFLRFKKQLPNFPGKIFLLKSFRKMLIWKYITFS